MTWRGAGHLTACLDAVAAQTSAHRVLVVDNASDDGSAALLAAHPSRPRVLRLAGNTGYAGGIAAALPRIDTEFVAWLNDDTEPAADWLAELEAALDRDPDAGAAAATLTTADGTPLSSGVELTRLGYGRDVTADRPDRVFGFCGGAALLRTEALRRAGGVPAAFFCYYEDTDTAWRLRLSGATVVPVPTARALHRHGASTRLGSRQFHRWNERNHLFTLLRCAPGRVAARELARFAAITAALPLRRHADPPWNLRVGLRLRVLGEVIAALPALTRQRGAITRCATVSRTAVWRAWAG